MSVDSNVLSRGARPIGSFRALPHLLLTPSSSTKVALRPVRYVIHAGLPGRCRGARGICVPLYQSEGPLP